MTLREQFAMYLTDVGYTRVNWADKRWIFKHPQYESTVYLGKSGSFRVGPNLARSRPISDAKRERILNRFVKAA
jgi:RecB family exonuclease